MDRDPSLGLEDIESPCYESLGVRVTATLQEIKLAYKRLSKVWHPDRHRGDESAKQVFQQILRAYQVLADPVTREQHDLQFGCLDQLCAEEYLHRYFYVLFTPQGLSLEMSWRWVAPLLVY